MSSIFTQITKEAEKQRELLVQQSAQLGASSTSSGKQSRDSSTLPTTDASAEIGSATIPADNTPASKSHADANSDAHPNATSASDVATSQSDVTRAKSSKRHSKENAGDTLGKGNRIDLDKLRTVIEELAAVKTGAFGFSVRMSEREQADIEEFVLDTLRKEGIKGYEVSIAKLMRYAMRYMFRVHPKEFVTALRAALQVEESLSI